MWKYLESTLDVLPNGQAWIQLWSSSLCMWRARPHSCQGGPRFIFGMGTASGELRGQVISEPVVMPLGLLESLHPFASPGLCIEIMGMFKSPLYMAFLEGPILHLAPSHTRTSPQRQGSGALFGERVTELPLQKSFRALNVVSRTGNNDLKTPPFPLRNSPTMSFEDWGNTGPSLGTSPFIPDCKHVPDVPASPNACPFTGANYPPQTLWNCGMPTASQSSSRPS